MASFHEISNRQSDISIRVVLYAVGIDETMGVEAIVELFSDGRGGGRKGKWWDGNICDGS